MLAQRFDWWRPLFILAGGLVLAGGPRHPGGTMAEMLGNPEWIPAHTLMLAGFLSLLLGLVAFSRDALTPTMRRWARVAVAGAALQAVEMALHTAAALDHANLMAGRATPILSTHLALAVFAYPVFAASMIGFMVAGARDRAMGSSPWIVWIGVLGAFGHGIAAPLVVLTAVPWARSLFPAVIGLAIWLILAGLLPRRLPVAVAQ
jgi:alkylhydroperoxidase/carboxymuconolactone decarboxylase family protein YurZ